MCVCIHYSTLNAAVTAAVAAVIFLSLPHPLQVLSYHVIPSAAVLSTQLVNNQSLPTALAGAAPLRVRIADGNVTFISPVNNATVIGADIEAGSSVIHVIDDVLLPAQVTLGGGNATDEAENATAADGAAEAPVYASIGEALTAANTSAANLTILLAAVQVCATYTGTCSLRLNLFGVQTVG
jgi:hypothetical protein